MGVDWETEDKEELGSNLIKPSPLAVCVFMGKFLNALELDAVFCGYVRIVE